MKNFLHNWYFIPEIVRDISPKYGLNCPKDWEKLISNNKKYTEFMRMIIERQLSLEREPNLVVDSSIYRVVSYANIAGLNVFDNYLAQVKYDLIIYCPIEFSFIEDGFRYSHNREEVDKELRRIIKKYHTGKFIEVTGQVDKRTKSALKVINSLFD